MGLHREVDLTGPVSFVSEMRRRIFTVVFNIDKGSSLLTGRPPALSSRYCRFKLPLDISEEVAMGSGEIFKRAVENLDVKGWNTEGKLHPATTTRAHGLLAIVLNEILELSLGDFGEGTNEQIKCVARIFMVDLLTIARNLMARLDDSYLSFPIFLRWNSEIMSSGEVSDNCVFTRLVLRLRMLEHRLLLERLAHKGLLNGQSMVDCAREMLELVRDPERETLSDEQLTAPLGS
jgi:hypothetical protein